ncbi:MAG: methylmalonyl Co-A mutase-associated GTPase MeaB [Ginsengibacter sp.]
MMGIDDQIELLKLGDFKMLSRSISLVENEVDGFEDLLKKLKPAATKIIGITGAPGSGKSSLADALINEIIKDNKRVGVICVDPSSPFTRGAILGDRIRMSEWYNNPNVFIRSLASKGSLGGLHPKIIEITELMKAANFDYIIIETVGVGQSEVDIAALADITIVLLTPEGGDIIQTMKAGLMEVADIFIINKYDRPDAANYYNNLKQMLAPVFHRSEKEIPILKTVATNKEGISELHKIILNWNFEKLPGQKLDLVLEKIWSIIQDKKMKEIDRGKLKNELAKEISEAGFNLYNFAEKYYK